MIGFKLTKQEQGNMDRWNHHPYKKDDSNHCYAGWSFGNSVDDSFYDQAF